MTTRADTLETHEIASSLDAIAAGVDTALESFVERYTMPDPLREAVRYTLLGGGKRLRPALAMLSCRAVGGEDAQALPAAMAVELIHAFSLVHDDLPAMDDDSLRRGRPTLHVAKGEAMAILTGDVMMGLAFAALTRGVDDPALTGSLVDELAQGANAMIAGQVYDTLGGFDDGDDDRRRLELIHRNKTGALILASCRMGALSGLADQSDDDHRRTLSLISEYGDAVGLMFQIVDDLIDVEQSAEHTGKQTRKDGDAGKLTYPGVLGAKASRAEVERLKNAARRALVPLGPPAEPLLDLCEFLAIRTK